MKPAAFQRLDDLYSELSGLDPDSQAERLSQLRGGEADLAHSLERMLTFLCNGNVIASSFSGQVYELDRVTGALVRTYDNPGGNRSSGLLAWPGQPGVMRSPSDSLVCPGGWASFEVVGRGSGPLSYHWQVSTGAGGWTDLTDATVALACGQATSLGSEETELHIRIDGCAQRPVPTVRLRCRVSNPCGTTYSREAILSLCPPDFNCDAFVDFFDYLDFARSFEDGDPAADVNADGFLDFFDYVAFVDDFEAGC